MVRDDRSPASSFPQRLLAALLALGLGVAASGCVAAAAGAAVGAGAAVAYNNRGVEGDVKGDPAQVKARTEAVFGQMGIQTTGTQMQKSGAEQQITGRAGDKDVTVSVQANGAGVSHVQVEARAGTLDWDRDYARDVLTRIVGQS
jgi:hypothetical protein